MGDGFFDAFSFFCIHKQWDGRWNDHNENDKHTDVFYNIS